MVIIMMVTNTFPVTVFEGESNLIVNCELKETKNRFKERDAHFLQVTTTVQGHRHLFPPLLI